MFESRLTFRIVFWYAKQRFFGCSSLRMTWCGIGTFNFFQDSILRKMNKFIDPKLYGLPPSTKLIQAGTDQFEIIIQRKSRIIMKDGEGIVAKVNKIKNYIPNARVSLKTSAPVCSKTKAFLEERGIRVLVCS